MPGFDICTICGKRQAQPITTDDMAIRDVVGVNCLVCGTYKMTSEACDDIQSKGEEVRSILSAISRERKMGRKSPPTFMTSLKNARDIEGCVGLDDIQNMQVVSVAEKLDKLILGLANTNPKPGGSLVVAYDRDYPLGHCSDGDEFAFLLYELESTKLLSRRETTKYLREREVIISALGWNRIDELKRPHVASKPRQAFVAMWFDKKDRNEREAGLKRGIEASGYDACFIDKLEYSGKIDDRVIAEIRKSKFVVADLTEQRQNVYFEAGFAEGIGLEVIYTCHDRDIGSVHFDKQQENIIVWTKGEELASKLQYRIVAVVGLPQSN